MFATGAKSVGRADLHSPASSPRSSPDPDVTEFLRSRAQSEFIFTNRENDSGEARDDAAESDEEAELVLFAGPSKAGDSHKIRLTSPEASGEPGMRVQKPRSYYFADEITSEREKEYVAAAVTGADVLDIAKIPWPGCAVPWKVRTITSSGLKQIVLVGHPSVPFEVDEQTKKRTRKGKKSRIALRKKMQATNDKQAEQARLAKEKEEAEREKRTRRNREKKVKRKAREQAKKEAAAGPGDPTPASPGSET
ncbi:hypothetical protein DPSP01_004068 [Paraphaeosphaeria sporulosa]|uniref:Uncharacterized protein n=1 Tax=Paraphaeosphaeria sporulosa TaxID=1460663 RepID=A0A177CTK6_9PLEO|nr:uncharacterized protein CC84DRAFT_1173194 [Paraphaeosphaeria sporulosa]OAG10865.1 hypothetical protein CC84DRAFT_1173194 [Paraphaeosphaeria sporulosa]